LPVWLTDWNAAERLWLWNTDPVVSRLFPDRHKYPYSLIRRRPLVPSPTMRLAASAVTMVGVDEVDSKGKPLSHSVKHYYTGVTFYNMQSGLFEGAARLSTGPWRAQIRAVGA